jgi:DNA-binding NtrC family response regulator
LEAVDPMTDETSEAPAEEMVSVLFVDDETSVLRMIQRAMAHAPFEVLTAPGPAQALAILESRRVDVLVSDIDMPEMDGLALVALVRRRHPTMIRILLSGQSTLARALQAINEGEVARFFPKPFNVATFRQTLEALTGRIERMRREGEELAKRDRRAEMHRWIDAIHPGTTSVDTSESGEVLIDVARVLSTVRAAGADDLLLHLRVHAFSRP